MTALESVKDAFRDFDKETGRHLACSIAIVASIVGAISTGAGTVAVATYDVGSVEEPQVIRPQPATEWPPLTVDETPRPQSWQSGEDRGRPVPHVGRSGPDIPERPITMKAAQDAFDVLDEPAPRHRRRHYRRRG